MRSYIEGVEAQAIESIKRYENGREELVISEHPEEGFANAIEHFQGLDDASWDLDGVFREYFPSLQRSSALVALFGFFENELNHLCELYKKTRSYNVSFKDLSGQGIERAAGYLEKVVNLNIQKQSQHWREIKDIQKLRNLLVHLNGKLVAIDGTVKKHEQDYVQQNKFLSGEREIVVCQGYLMHVFKTVNEYFQLLDAEIEKQENA
jgi:hypothetical protein